MVYIVVKDEGDYEQRDVYNEAVFDEKEKAINYIKDRGYIWNDKYNEWEKPDDGGYPECYRLEEWSINTVLDNKNDKNT
ncbi:hypothetical protein [Oceanobacillus picturae]|uniref:hypothetical protein n=1 Tax=Oceanobacillus picturae TaxID=171693 RepID=UPI00073D651F|nr:hypothetical protein [Oceanobacillus picturae]